MIPETVGAVGGLLLVVGPGLAFTVVRERYRPSAEHSVFREGASTALASLAFTAIALVAAALFRLVWPEYVADPRLWLLRGRSYVAAEFPRVALTVLAVASVAMGLAAAVPYVWLRWIRRDRSRIDPTATGWSQLFRKKAPAGSNTMVRVRLNDGTEYQGLIAFYSANVLPDERELALRPPILLKGPHDDGFGLLPDGDAQALAQNYPNCLQMSATVGVDKDVVSPLGSPWLNRLLHLPLT